SGRQDYRPSLHGRPLLLLADRPAARAPPQPAAFDRGGRVGTLRARGLRTRPQGPRLGRGEPVIAELARAGGPVAAAGLATLFVARRRELRLAGLAALGLGCVALAYYLAPHGHRPLLAGAAAGGIFLARQAPTCFCAGRGCSLSARWPACPHGFR